MTHEPEPSPVWWKNEAQRTMFERRAAAGGISRRTLLGIIGAFAAGTALAACSDDKKTGSPPSGAVTTAAPAETLAKEQNVTIALDVEPATLDINKDLFSLAGSGLTSELAGLLQFDENFNVRPDIAESFTVNAAGDVYTFKIRGDSRWSNGDPVTTRDFEWSWKRNLDPATAATYAGFLFDIKGAERFNSKAGTVTDVMVRAVDDTTLAVTLEGPRGYFPALVAFPSALPAHRASVEKQGNAYGQDAATFVGNGPYNPVVWNTERSLEFVKHDGYWNAANVTVSKIKALRIPTNAQLLAYENGEIDYFDYVPFGDLKRLRGDARLSKELFKFSVVGVWYLMPNPTFKPFDDPRVRLAMAHAIDRERIARDVFDGAAEAAYTLNPPGTPGYNPNKYDQYTSYEGKDARKYLQGTPYEGGRNWPAITLTQAVEGDVDAAAAQAMVQMLKDNLGMSVEHEIGERRSTYMRMYQNKLPLMWVRWYMDYPDAHNTNWQLFSSKVPASGRRSQWVHADYDRLVEQAKEEKDQEKRRSLYAQADEVLAKEAGAIFVHWPYRFGMIKPWLKGMPVNTQGEPVPNFNIFVRQWDRMRVLEH